jgi:hypothetical protein
MSGRIPVSSPRAVQLVAIAGALVLLANAFFIATEGRSFPPYRCPPPWEPPVSYLLGGIRFGVGLGLLAAALRDPLGGLRLPDPLLIGMFLVLAASVALESAGRGIATGIVYLGRRGCIDVGPPMGYALAIGALVVGVVALAAAAMVLASGERQDDE